ncbi:MAG TPA: PH domain-containing protein [Flavobacterium sp.]|nr:PH domain-containing protein [Flavobacterium sp.]
MDNFTNDVIDTKQLPRFEEVKFEALHPYYWKVIMLNLLIFYIIIFGAAAVVWYFNPEVRLYLLEVFGGLLFLSIIIFWISRISFAKKGYAFRTHDVLFRSGIISTNTTIIPYNRVQHVALNEGLIMRRFGLSEIGIYTAGASGSDLEIPGIAKEEAESIKQLLMGKIQKTL